MGEDMVGSGGRKTACEKETPITRINSEARRLREMALAALQEVLKIEEFLIGQEPIGTSECKAEQEKGGWTEQHLLHLVGTERVLDTLLGHLASLKTLIT